MVDFYDQKPWLKTYPAWLPESIAPAGQSILDDFQRSLTAHPDAPCIHYFDASYSYREIADMTYALAAALNRIGLRRGDRVVLVMQNIPQIAIGSLAVWMCAAVVVPINPMYTAEEQSHLVSDCGARMIICQEDFYALMPAHSGKSENLIAVITTSPLDMLASQDIPSQLQKIKRHACEGALDFMSLIKNEADAGFEVARPAAQDLAYLVYTSGTTGPPKGAMLTHSNIVYNTRVYQTAAQLDRSDVVLGVAPLFHITGIVAHLAVAFHLAIPVVLFYRFDVADILRLIEKHRVTFTVASITVYTALLNHPDAKKYDITSFKKAYSGGAPVSPSIVKRCKEILGLAIHNIYGLTESASPATITPLGQFGPVDPESGALSVGLVIPGLEAWIVSVDKPEEILPPGQAGELVLRGPCMVQGYWEKPAETAHAIKDGRFFTGDVAKMDDQGWCYIVDRKKDLINVSGYKVWPRDVEDVLYQHPAVKEAAVIGVPDEYRGETVMAFVAVREGYQDTITASELISFCKKKMAAFKYPRKLEIIDEVPKTPTGKFLRRQLREQLGH
ncbi:MAG: AMP-binding protein [Desulfobacterales bacterium]|nr:AMP-binding protein [Desulfobacterales bacterium]